MSKSKKKKRPINMKKAIKQKKVHFWDKELTVKQQILMVGIIIAILIAVFFIAAYFIGYYKISSQGYDTSDILVEKYLSAIDNNDSQTIENCFSLYSYGNYEDTKKQKNIAKEMSDNISIDISSLKISNDLISDTDDIKRNLKNNNISEAKMVYATFDMTELANGMECSQKETYKFITYQYNVKWYIYAVQKLNAYTKSLKWKNSSQIDYIETNMDMADTTEIGNDGVGYINVGSDWKTYGNHITNYSNETTYASSDNTATISLASINTTASLDKSIDSILLDLQDRGIDSSRLSVTDQTFCGYTAKQITMFENSEESDNHGMIWIFKTSEKSNITYYVEFDYALAGQSAINYVNTFHIKKTK